MLKHMIRVRLIQMRCPIGNRESPVCIFISDIKQGRPAFLMFKIQCLRSQRLQFSHLFQCKTCCLKSRLQSPICRPPLLCTCHSFIMPPAIIRLLSFLYIYYTKARPIFP